MEKKMAGKQPLRIAITGPESTGKTLLCKQLADYYREPWVPEFSRDYLKTINRSYDFMDILEIAKGQYNSELSLMQQAKNYLFCDTDFMVTHIWALVKYGKSHEWIDKMAKDSLYDYTLLCNIDLPWEFDPLREHPNQRDQLYAFYHRELTQREIPFSVVQGRGNERLNSAIAGLTSQGIVPGHLF